MEPSPIWGRYAELRPDALAIIRRKTPVAFLPWGALEWHGPHLPLGIDGTIAEAVAERVARRVGGVLLPTTWWPAAAIPSADTLAVRGETIQALWDDIFASLAQAGWHIVVVISGVYSPGQDLALMAAAQRAIAEHHLLALVVPPLALVDEEMLDRAGLWESSLLMAIRPDQVALDALGAAPLRPATSGVVGRDPRGTASASIGTRALALAVDRIANATTQLLTEGNSAPLKALYERRRERYQSLAERFAAAPADATQAWWKELTGEK